MKPNKEQLGGVVRADAQTRKKCQVTCLEREENCAGFGFRNGVCRIHHLDEYEDQYSHYEVDMEDTTLTVAYGNKHYRVVDSVNSHCPPEWPLNRCLCRKRRAQCQEHLSRFVNCTAVVMRHVMLHLSWACSRLAFCNDVHYMLIYICVRFFLTSSADESCYNTCVLSSV